MSFGALKVIVHAQRRIQTQHDSSQLLWVPTKISPKMIKRGFF